MTSFYSLKQFSNIQKIGCGRLTTVFKATYQQQQLVLKILKTQISIYDQDITKKLNAQFQLHQQPTPLILQFYGYFFDQETQQLVLVNEFAEEGDLQSFITRINFRRTNKTHLTLILNLFIDILAGALYLSNNNILHSELKPKNIHIFQDEILGYKAKIQNFNLSEMLLTSSHETPYFIAPEVLENKNYGYATDVWSLGVMLYYIFSGVFPYRGNNVSQQLKLINTKPPNKLPNDVPLLFKTLIGQMLKVDPEERILLVNILLYKPFEEIVNQRLPEDLLFFLEDCQ